MTAAPEPATEPERKHYANTHTVREHSNTKEKRARFCSTTGATMGNHTRRRQDATATAAESARQCCALAR